LRDVTPSPLSEKEYHERLQEFESRKAKDAAISHERRLLEFRKSSTLLNASATSEDTVSNHDSHVASLMVFSDLNRTPMQKIAPPSVASIEAVSPLSATFKPLQINEVSLEDIEKANELVNGQSAGSRIRAKAVELGKTSVGKKKQYNPKDLLGNVGNGTNDWLDSLTNKGAILEVKNYRAMLMEDIASHVLDCGCLKGTVTKTLDKWSLSSTHYSDVFAGVNTKVLKPMWDEFTRPGVDQEIKKRLNHGLEGGGKMIATGSEHMKSDHEEQLLRKMLEILEAQSEHLTAKETKKAAETAKVKRAELFDDKSTALANGKDRALGDEEEDQEFTELMPKRKKPKPSRDTLPEHTSNNNQTFRETMEASAAVARAKASATNAKTEERKAKLTDRLEKGKRKKFESNNEIAEKLLNQWTMVKDAGLGDTPQCQALYDAWVAAVGAVVTTSTVR
jgi:hypothetical protein